MRTKFDADKFDREFNSMQTFIKVFFVIVMLMVLGTWAFYAFVATKAVGFVSECDNPALVTKTEDGKTSYSFECQGND